MSIVNQTIPATPYNKAPPPSTQSIVGLMHQKIAQAMRTYNANIVWVSEQVNEGHLNSNELLTILTKAPSPMSHQSPIEKAINERYTDPTLASLLENTSMTLPNHLVHAAAKLLTMGHLNKDLFPPICLVNENQTTTLC